MPFPVQINLVTNKMARTTKNVEMEIYRIDEKNDENEKKRMMKNEE